MQRLTRSPTLTRMDAAMRHHTLPRSQTLARIRAALTDPPAHPLRNRKNDAPATLCEPETDSDSTPSAPLLCHREN
eukprot:8998583-Pyramimonas_sp.AAC.1